MKLRAWLTEESLRLAAFQAWWKPDPGPKFRIGQRVQLKNWNVKGTIEGYAYKLERQGYADESSIEPVEQKS